MKTIHDEAHHLAGEILKLSVRGKGYEHCVDGAEFRLEDWWDRVAGESWMNAQGNPAAMIYGIRSGTAGLPTDNKVVYGHINGLGYLVHVSELQEGSVDA